LPQGLLIALQQEQQISLQLAYLSQACLQQRSYLQQVED
jgi:hypothetical protein